MESLTSQNGDDGMKTMMERLNKEMKPHGCWRREMKRPLGDGV